MDAPCTASIVIANFDYGRYLSDAIDSALAQTWPHVQVIVVDDGSTDESALIMQTYGDAIETIYKENGGQSSAVNAGFELVTGDAVIFLDSDDMLDPETVEKTIGAFADPEVVKVCWPFRIIDAAGTPTGDLKFTHLPQGSFREKALRMGPASHFTPAQSGNFWRKTYLDAVLPIPVADFRSVADSYLFTFAPFFGSFVTYPEPLTSYRVHNVNISKSAGARFRKKDWDTRARYLEAFLTQQGEDVSIEHWEKNSAYRRRLVAISSAHSRVAAHVPRDAPIALVANYLFQRGDMHPLRPVHRAPDRYRSPKRTERDFRRLLSDLADIELEYLVVEGPRVSNTTNLPVLLTILRAEHEILYEDSWIVIARLRQFTPVDAANAAEKSPAT